MNFRNLHKAALAAVLAGSTVAIGVGAAHTLGADAPANVALPTLGGKQFWADERAAGGWRIQHNVLTDHYRLLDPENIRRAWGGRAAVDTAFDALRAAGEIPNYGPHLVIFVHGIIRSGGSFSTIVGRVGAAGFDTLAVSYPSTRRTIAQHADQLDALIAGLDGVETISFVTHSMGGLVVRELLSRQSPWRDRISVGRAVLIAPPSQGSAIARLLQDNPVYGFVYGAAGQELVPAAVTRLPGLDIEFAVIAGGKSDGEGFNPLIDGDDDGVVGVDEARLDGASDFLLVEDIHTTISNHPRTVDAAVRFLTEGRF